MSLDWKAGEPWWEEMLAFVGSKRFERSDRYFYRVRYVECWAVTGRTLSRSPSVGTFSTPGSVIHQCPSENAIFKLSITA